MLMVIEKWTFLLRKKKSFKSASKLSAISTYSNSINEEQKCIWIWYGNKVLLAVFLEKLMSHNGRSKFSGRNLKSIVPFPWRIAWSISIKKSLVKGGKWASQPMATLKGLKKQITLPYTINHHDFCHFSFCYVSLGGIWTVKTLSNVNKFEVRSKRILNDSNFKTDYDPLLWYCEIINIANSVKVELT